MVKIKWRTLRTTLCLFLFSFPGFSQTKSTALLQQSINSAIAKAYAATVKIVAFDTLTATAGEGFFTGVVVSKNGKILTAAHAVSTKNVYQVTFADGKTATARCMGRIGAYDAALLSIIQKNNYPFAELGWSYPLKRDQPCISMGFPFELKLQRNPFIRFGYVINPSGYGGYIQSSCLMEPGDSGGPLFDLHGRVIGIHSYITNSEKDNFDIPIDLFRKHWTMLAKKGNHFKSDLSDTLPLGKDPLEYKLSGYPSMANLAEAFQSVQTQFKAAIVPVNSQIDNEEVQVSGTIIQLNGIFGHQETDGTGYVLSKSSMVGSRPFVKGLDGKSLTANIIDREVKSDLVLLSVKGLMPVRGLKGEITAVDISPRQHAHPAQLGAFMVSLSGHHPSAVVSVAGTQPFHMETTALSGGPAIFLHDAILRKEDLGAAVFNASGVFIGINIAKPSRTSVIAVPADVVNWFVRKAIQTAATK